MRGGETEVTAAAAETREVGEVTAAAAAATETREVGEVMDAAAAEIREAGEVVTVAVVVVLVVVVLVACKGASVGGRGGKFEARVGSGKESSKVAKSVNEKL